ncbi:MAG: GntR family transcriptional regulator [Alphaproteobacteria bacterium]|nr:GntR family transcriptional regulator [Alphaproteobacteria bacterium]
MTIFSQITADAPARPATARSIETHLRAEIAEGRVPAGTRLPPIREAAWQLGCAPATVARLSFACGGRTCPREVGRGTSSAPRTGGCLSRPAHRRKRVGCGRHRFRGQRLSDA